MNSPSAQLGTEQVVGAIRRSANSVNEAVNAIRAANQRLEAIKARVQGIHAEIENVDEAPEPARNDIEELDYQIGQVHTGLSALSNHIDDVNSI